MGVFVCGDSGGGSSRWAMGRHEQFVHWSNIAHAMSGEQLYVHTYIHKADSRQWDDVDMYCIVHVHMYVH